MFADVLTALRCPHDGGELALATQAPHPIVGCARGHRFDVARQGYLNLLTDPAPAAADTAAMVSARLDVLRAGHLDPLSEALALAARTAWSAPPPSGEGRRAGYPGGGPSLVVDLGAGPGHHLAVVIEATGGRAGLAVDLSKHAARRATRAHPRVGAVVADVRNLPMGDATAEVVLVVFAPRAVGEIARILRPGGVLVVATPEPDHLTELSGPLGLLSIDPGKPAALDVALAGIAERVDRRTLRWQRDLPAAAARAIALSGPSAHHLDVVVLEAAIEQLPPVQPVTFAVTLSTYRRS